MFNIYYLILILSNIFKNKKTMYRNADYKEFLDSKSRTSNKLLQEILNEMKKMNETLKKIEQKSNK